ncbi:MAG TPA: hypothetical protein VK843_20965 [Planctomycetota bacterium]|nr:hypothetical protein [Planctomycetota bacterium]
MIALMVTVGIAMLGACLLQFSASASRAQLQSVDQKRAFYVAEAGLSESVYGLMLGKSGNIGSAESPARFGDGVLWVEAVKTEDGRIVIESNGLCGGGRASLSIVVAQHASSMAALGIFSNGNLVVHSGSVIDSYDPEAQLLEGLVGGLLDGVEPSGSGKVGSNGNITVNGTKKAKTRIDGDVTPGVDKTVTSGAHVTITGSTIPRTTPVVLPPIEVPALVSQGALLHVASRSMTIPTGEHRYDSLTIGSNSQLVVVGPQTLVIGSMVLLPGAKLVMDTSDGKVDIHATDYLNFGTGSVIDNLEHDPAKAHIYISASQTIDRNGDGIPDPPATLRSTGKMYATVYAPAASLVLSGGLEVYGAVTAANLELGENSKLHFDESLLVDDGTGPDDVKLLSWKVLELPPEPQVKTRVDPVVLLRLQGAPLLSPGRSHQKVDFKIEFISKKDKTGKTRIWQGEESKFNWKDVQSVVRLGRIGDLIFGLL